MTPTHATAEALEQRIHRFVDASLANGPDERFEALASDIHAWQRMHVPAVASLSGSAATEDWTEIPAVPVELFRHLPLGPPDAPVVFRTSGTTGRTRGAHRLPHTRLADHGAQAWADRCVPGLPHNTAALLLDPQRHPDVSLSHMVSVLTRGASAWHQTPEGLDVAGLNATVSSATAPLFVPATAFALHAWLDHAPQLPDGSVLMVTGGFKGRVTNVDSDDLLHRARLRLRPARTVLEYGMTELSSQLWSTYRAPYLPPPWMRVVAADPHTGAHVAAGVPGQLRFFDLCNLYSTVGIETMDWGTVHADGSVHLQGRIPDAPHRGCSLTAEEADRGAS